MKTIFVILKKNGESDDYDIYRDIVENVTDELIEQYTWYKIDVVCKHETDEGIYAGYLPDDEDLIADFNHYIADGYYCRAYSECTLGSVFFKKETI